MIHKVLSLPGRTFWKSLGSNVTRLVEEPMGVKEAEGDAQVIGGLAMQEATPFWLVR